MRTKKLIVLLIIPLLFGLCINSAVAWFNTPVQTSTMYMLGEPVTKLGTTTQYGYDAPASDTNPHFYSALIASGRGVLGFLWFPELVKIEVSGTDPNGDTLMGDRFSDLGVLSSPDDSGVEQVILKTIYDVLVSVLPTGLEEIVKNTISAGGATTEQEGTKAWGKWQRTPLGSAKQERGLRFHYALVVDPTLEGTYTINIHYHAWICSLGTDNIVRHAGYIDLYDTVYYAYKTKHDVAVTSVEPVLPYGGTALYAGLQVPIEVTVENQGSFTETFGVTAYYDSTEIGTQMVTNLAAGDPMTLTFTWNTTDIIGTFTIYAQASIVSGESETGDNTFIYGDLQVKIPGDINGDGIVDIYDAVLLIRDIDATPGSPDWNNGRSDFNNDGIVDVLDVTILCTNYGKTGGYLGGEFGESSSPVYASPTKLSVVFPNGTTSSIGEYFPTETFTVNITVEDVTNLYGFDFTLKYNASLLTAAPSVTIGDFFGSEYIIWHEEVNNDVGYVWYAVSQDTYEEGVNGSGTLATISFTVDSLGGTILDLWNTKLSDSDGNPIAHEVYDGSFANILKADLVQWKAKPAHKHHVISIHGTINPLYALVQNLGAQSVTVKVKFTIYADNGGAPVTSFETSEYTFEEGTYLTLHIFDTSTDVTPSEFDSSLHGTGNFYVEAKCLYYDGANWIGGEIKTFSFIVIP